MKRLLLLSIAFVTMISPMQAFAETNPTEPSPKRTTESGTISTYSEKDNIQKKQSEFAFNYMHPKGGHAGAWGMDVMLKHVLLGYNVYWMKDSPSKYAKFDVYAGGNYRYFLGKYFYLEGRVLAGYGHANISGNKDGWGYLGISPRLGLNLFHFKNSSLALVAGFEADFLEFKFKKGYIGKSFTFGIAVPM